MTEIYFRKSILVILLITLYHSAFTQAPVISYQTPQSYLINSAITPLTPANSGGAVPATIYAQVSTMATSTYNTSFSDLTGIAIDPSGNLFVDVFGYNDIVELNTAGAISTLAGNPSRSGLINGQGSAATFYEPDGLIMDQAGNFYVSEVGNNVIRKITPSGSVTTFAGNGLTGLTNGAATIASFNSPRGLAIDPAGNIYVADQANNVIRKITPAGVVSTMAGSSTGAAGFINGSVTAATFNTPTGVGIDAAGNLYVADAGNYAIRKITTAGVVSTLAAGFSFPREIRVDGTGNLYIADQQGYCIKRVSPTGIVTTIAGTGRSGSADGFGNVATFSGPIGLILDGKGNLFAADNNLIRKIIVSGYTIDKTLPAGLSFDPTTGIISGTPTALSAATDYTVTAYNGGGSNSTIVNIEVVATIVLKPSVITFPPPVGLQIGANNILYTGATSTNTQTPITYASSNTAVAYVGTDGQIHVIAPGTTVITASQAGNANYNPATSVSETYIITEQQIIQFPALSVKTTCDIDFASGAVSSNALLPVSYSSSNPSVATISAQGVIHIVDVGTSVITASQPGNVLYDAAVPVSQTLTVSNPIVPVVSITPDRTSVCAGMPVTFTAAVSDLNTNLSYQWQVNGVNAGTNSATFTTIPSSSTDVFQCLVTNNVFCSTVGTSNAYTGIIVDQYVSPSVIISSSAVPPVCSGTTVIFTAVPTNGGTSPVYQWLVNGVNAGTNSATFTSNTFADGDVVTCTLTNNNSACLIAATATSNAVTVNLSIPNPAPSVSISASANNVYPGTSITFTAIPANAGTVTSYKWQINGENLGINAKSFITDRLNNNDVVTCTIVSSVPCTVPATSVGLVTQVIPLPSIVIPNTFTPNGDSINDNWSIPSLVNYPGCVVSVYSRNGVLVFQSKGYAIPWDGTFNGKPLPVSTYYYVIKPSDKIENLSGYVMLMR